MPKADPAEIRRLIGVVESKLSALPDIEVCRRESYEEHRRAGERALIELEKDEGAKWRSRYDGVQLSLGGIKTSCTSGTAGVLRNWVTAARRRITAGFFNVAR